MHVFKAKVFDGFVNGTGSVYTQTAHAELLGRVERLSFGAVVSAVTGTNQHLTVQIENSPDGTRWMNQSTAGPEMDVGPLNSGDNLMQWRANNTSTTVPMPGFVRMRIAFTGTSPAGYIRLWVAGRSPAF